MAEGALDWARGRQRWLVPAGWAALAAVLVVAALFRVIERDDGQYVGAVALMRTGLPFRDFLYLQTPLQPLLLAPLAWIADGWLYPALRVVNALCAAAGAGLLYRLIVEGGGGRRIALFGAACLLCSHAFLFGATQARNDMVPLVLHLGGLLLLLRVWRGEARMVAALVAGLLLGAAASAKISYGLPAVAAGAMALACWRQLGAARVAAFALGGLAGLVPCLVLWGLAPDAFLFGVFRYSIDAPVEWRTLIDQPEMLGWPIRLGRSALFLVQGPGLLALAVVIADRIRRPRVGGVTALLDAILLGAVVAALLPVPAYPQYWIPVLPALFARFALLLAERKQRRIELVALLLLPVGLFATVVDVAGNLAAGRSPPIEALRDARWTGAMLDGFDVPGAVGGLAPEALVSSGRALDRRFVTGPFLFRTQGVLTAGQAEAFHVVTQRSFAAALDAERPAGLLLGSEAQAFPWAPHGLDGLLADWAASRGYKSYSAPSGRRVLWVRP